MTRYRRDFPSVEEGQEATRLGVAASDAGQPIGSCPYSDRAGFRESCLASCWRRGYRYAQQARLQAKYGDAPSV